MEGVCSAQVQAQTRSKKFFCQVPTFAFASIIGDTEGVKMATKRRTKKAGKTLYTFERGFPTKGAAQRARDDAYYQRALTAYRFWYPTVSLEGVFNGYRKKGISENQSVGILACKPHHVFYTPNADTPYGNALVDLKNGPMVVDFPPGPYIAVAMDHNDTWIMDAGIPGPDQGKGGKHVILPPGYQGKVPDGYYIARSATYKIVFAIRALPSDGDIQAALESLRKIKIYPLQTAHAPASLNFVDLTDTPLDLTPLAWEDNMQFWQKLHEIIDYEPLAQEFRAMYGLLKAIGIEKGKPFVPDSRMKSVLERAARDGRDQLLVSAFASDRPDRIAWTDRKWEWAALIYDSADFDTPSGPDLEARDRWFAEAQGESPAMFRRKEGSGSLYWLGFLDAKGQYLDGGKTYKLTVPQPVPASLFWSITVYDIGTRTMIQTDQNMAALRSMVELRAEKLGKDVKRADLYFGPKAPTGKSGRWIKTSPGKGWFTYFRIYGPQKSAFDGSWKPGDFEVVK